MRETDWLFEPILFENGVVFNVGINRDDPIEVQIRELVICLLHALRGHSPNAQLGETDSYVFAGEWGLAFEEMQAIVEKNRELETSITIELIRRLRFLI